MLLSIATCPLVRNQTTCLIWALSFLSLFKCVSLHGSPSLTGRSVLLPLRFAKQGNNRRAYRGILWGIWRTSLIWLSQSKYNDSETRVKRGRWVKCLLGFLGLEPPASPSHPEGSSFSLNHNNEVLASSIKNILFIELLGFQEIRHPPRN